MVKCQLEFPEFPKFCQELIGNLHGSDDFADIALIGDDNKTFKAHNFVLRSHSNVIMDALSSTDFEKPLIYLKGFSSHDIQCLLDFMYLGETSCEPKNVKIFFKTGKFLQIKQLVEECEDNVENQFSLEVLDQFCDIVGDSEVKSEEINQMETNPMDDENEFGGVNDEEISEEIQEMNVGVNDLLRSPKTVQSSTIPELVSGKDSGKSEKDFTKKEAKKEEMFKRLTNVKVSDDDCQLPQVTEQSSKSVLKMQRVAVKLFDSVMESFDKADPSKDYKSLDETNIEDLNPNLCKFFYCLVKPDGSSYNSESLKAYFYAIQNYLRRTKNINIKQDERFRELIETVKERTMTAKKSNSPQSSAFREEDIQRAFMNGTIGRGSPEALVTLIVYNLMMDFGCKSIAEIQEIRNSDIIYGPLNDQSEPQFIQIYPDSVWEKRKEKSLRTNSFLAHAKRMIDDNHGRVYLDSKLPHTCPVGNILFYQNKKTPKQLNPDMPFLLCTRKFGMWNLSEEFWFQDIRMGKESIQKLFKNALVSAGVDITGQKITPMSARKARIESKLKSI